MFLPPKKNPHTFCLTVTLLAVGLFFLKCQGFQELSTLGDFGTLKVAGITFRTSRLFDLTR